MKRIKTLLIALIVAAATQAQTLHVSTGRTTYQFPAASVGEMTFSNGSTLTIMGKAFALGDVDSMSVDQSAVTNNLVSIAYNDGGEASVCVAGNVAPYVRATVSGNHVVIEQSNTAAVDGDEITYQLSGTASDGSFELSGAYKCTIALAGVTLTNPGGAAINISNSKRIQLSAKSGTINTLSDAAGGSQKACIYSKGQLQLQGKGTLIVSGLTKHAIKSASYVSLKNLTLQITAAAGDGISCEEYFLMQSGSVTMSGLADDGIQCDLDGTASTGETTDHDGEDSGNIYIEGGTLDITTTVVATKCLKSAGSVSVKGGTLTLKAEGAPDVSNTADLSYAAGIKAANFTQSGGDITINVSGAAGRGIAADTTFATTAQNTGTLTITMSGAPVSSGTTYFATAKGIKAGTVNIAGGTVNITMSSATSCGKGIKADSDGGTGNLNITGGTVTVSSSGAGAYDSVERDAKGAACLKADGNMLIGGGTLNLTATGTGGKPIKADGTLQITDGTVVATARGSQYRTGSYTASAKAIKSNGDMTISGGTVTASSSSHEGIESKSTLTIEDGYVYVSSSDDAINSAGEMYIKGGYVMAVASGDGGDGIDANGNLRISGGNVFAVAASQPEVGLDANTEGGKQLYITGGNIVAIGGLERGASLSNGTAMQASSYTKGAWYGLDNGSTLAFAFKVPSNSSMGSGMVVFTSGTPALKQGVTGSGTAFWSNNGYDSCSGGSNVTLSTYNSSSGGGPGGGGPGGGGGRW